MNQTGNSATNREVEITGEFINKIASDIVSRKDGVIKGLPTGFSMLDEVLGGLNNGDLIVIAGHPSSGVTSFALGVLEHLSINKNIPTLYVSMDRSKEELIRRILFGKARIDLLKARRGTLTNDEIARLNKTTSEVTDKPLYIDDTARLSPSEVRAKAVKLKDSKGIQCIVIDYLQAMRLKDKIDLQEDDFAEIARTLKLMAHELDVPVILLVELSLDLIREEEERFQPRITDLGKAIIVERFADVLMLVNRADYYGGCAPDDRSTEMMIIRNKKGETGSVYLSFWHEYARFREASAGRFGNNSVE